MGLYPGIKIALLGMRLFLPEGCSPWHELATIHKLFKPHIRELVDMRPPGRGALVPRIVGGVCWIPRVLVPVI